MEAEDSAQPFAPRIQSFEYGGKYYHAFENTGDSLEAAPLDKLLLQDDGETPLPQPVADAVRITLIRDLLDAVYWCHLQGLPILTLNSQCVRISKMAPTKGKRRGFWRLSLAGIGAGPQIASRKTVFQLSNESWPFNPPETLEGSLLQGNLPGLYSWDAWSTAVIITMICGGYNDSPFNAEVEQQSAWNPFGFNSGQVAVGKKVRGTFEDYSSFLTKLNEDSDGFLFRHGWVVELVIGMLNLEPTKRLSVVNAWELMSTAREKEKKRLKGDVNLGRFKPPEKKKAPAPMSAAFKEKLERAFKEFDVEKNGVITVENIMAAMQLEGKSVSREQATRALGEVDSNGDGVIDLEEFMGSLPKMVRELANEPDELTASVVFGPRFTSNEGEPYRSLESMISIADKGLCEVLIEAREQVKNEGDLKNYGEIVGFRNRADGDRWDVVAPGLENQLASGSKHRLSAVLGVIMIKGGNHKLVVALSGSTPDKDKTDADVQDFMNSYSATHENVRSQRRMRFMKFENPYTRSVKSLDSSLLELAKDLAKDPKDPNKYRDSKR